MKLRMQQYLDKKQKYLIEALPYIQRFNNGYCSKIWWKCHGRRRVKSKSHSGCYTSEISGFKPIIVHGGGKEISKWVGKVGIEPEFYQWTSCDRCRDNGIAEMVLGKVNKSLVQLVETAWCQSHRYQWKRWKTSSESREETGRR